MFDSLRDTLTAVTIGEVIAAEFGDDGAGVLITAADRTTPQAVDFMIRHSRSPICLALTPERIAALRLGPSGIGSRSALTFPFSLRGHSGCDAEDVARTIRRAVELDAQPCDFVRPGQVITLRAGKPGPRQSFGEAELAVDLARLAGREQAGVVSPLLGEDGLPANKSHIHRLAHRYGLKPIQASDALEQRRSCEPLTEPLQPVELPTEWGHFMAYPFTDRITGECHVALVVGDITTPEPVLARIHSECLTGDSWHSLRCDCGLQLATAMQTLQAAGRGVLLYLRQEGRGIGLANKMRAYALQDRGLDTVEANLALGLPVDARDYGVAAEMLQRLSVSVVRLMTNNPDKVLALLKHGVDVLEHLPLEVPSNPSNRHYLETKRKRLNHWLKEPHVAST